MLQDSSYRWKLDNVLVYCLCRVQPPMHRKVQVAFSEEIMHESVHDLLWPMQMRSSRAIRKQRKMWQMLHRYDYSWWKVEMSLNEDWGHTWNNNINKNQFFSSSMLFGVVYYSLSNISLYAFLLISMNKCYLHELNAQFWALNKGKYRLLFQLFKIFLLCLCIYYCHSFFHNS